MNRLVSFLSVSIPDPESMFSSSSKFGRCMAVSMSMEVEER
jgi:hypothetical protein